MQVGKVETGVGAKLGRIRISEALLSKLSRELPDDNHPEQYQTNPKK